MVCQKLQQFRLQESLGLGKDWLGLALPGGIEEGLSHCDISPKEVRGTLEDRQWELGLKLTLHMRPDGFHRHPEEPELPAHHLVHKQLVSGKESLLLISESEWARKLLLLALSSF